MPPIPNPPAKCFIYFWKTKDYPLIMDNLNIQRNSNIQIFVPNFISNAPSKASLTFKTKNIVLYTFTNLEISCFKLISHSITKKREYIVKVH